MGLLNRNSIVSYLAPGRTHEAKSTSEKRRSRVLNPADIPVFPPSPIINEKGGSNSSSGTGSPRGVVTDVEKGEKGGAVITVGETMEDLSDTESRPNSQMFPAGDFRNNAPEELRDIKCDVMVNWLYQQQMEMLWTAGAADEGVVLKKTRGNYTCCPPDLMEEPFGFFKSIEMLNVRVSLRTRAITAQIERC